MGASDRQLEERVHPVAIFDDSLHPRNRRGMFIESLRRLAVGSEITVAGRYRIRKRGRSFDVLSPTGKKVGKRVSASEAADLIDKHVAAPPTAHDLMSGRGWPGGVDATIGPTVGIGQVYSEGVKPDTPDSMSGYVEYLRGRPDSSVLADYNTNLVNAPHDPPDTQALRAGQLQVLAAELQRRGLDSAAFRVSSAQEREARVQRVFQREQRAEAERLGAALVKGSEVKVDSLGDGFWPGRVVKTNKNSVDVEVTRPDGGTFSARYLRDSISARGTFSVAGALSIPKRR